MSFSFNDAREQCDDQIEIDHIRFWSRTPPIVTFGLRSSAIFGNLRYRRFHQPSVFGTEDKNSLRSTPNPFILYYIDPFCTCNSQFRAFFTILLVMIAFPGNRQ